ncbi:MAG TPA: ABC transporter permease [Abditibacterium sp.]|jgi:lipopolysaccharide transport system permease protein
MNAQKIRTEAPKRPHLRIEPDKGWVALNLREVWRFRDLLLTLAARDVKLRYRQTALGVLWVVLQPLLGAGILSFVFNTIAGLPTDGVSPFAFSFAGMLGYTVFSSILTKASTSLVQNSQMVSKVFFPRLILPISVTFSSFLDFAVGFVVMLFLLLGNHIALTPALLLIPIWLLLISMLALGVGLFFGALMVSYRDVQYVVPVLIGLLNFASPVAYPVSFVLSKLSSGVHPLYFLLNPLAALLSAFRWSLLGQGDVEWRYVVFSAGVSVVVFFIGAYAFKSLEGRLADVI